MFENGTVRTNRCWVYYSVNKKNSFPVSYIQPQYSLPYRKYVLGKILVDLHEIGYARPPKHRKLFTISNEKQPTEKLFRSSVSQKGPLYPRTNFLYGSEKIDKICNSTLLGT